MADPAPAGRVLAQRPLRPGDACAWRSATRARSCLASSRRSRAKPVALQAYLTKLAVGLGERALQVSFARRKVYSSLMACGRTNMRPTTPGSNRSFLHSRHLEVV
jgi:hypothetical protein